MTGPFGTTGGDWFAVDDHKGVGETTIRGGSHHYPIVQVSSYWRGPGPRSDESLKSAAAIAQVPAMLALVEAVYSSSSDPALADMARAIIAELEKNQ